MKRQKEVKKKSNKYIAFHEPFKDLEGRKFPSQVKYRITDEDQLFYYIKNGGIDIRINKYLENEIFTVGEIVNY